MDGAALPSPRLKTDDLNASTQRCVTSWYDLLAHPRMPQAMTRRSLDGNREENAGRP
jgi:hypothetical protein